MIESNQISRNTAPHWYALYTRPRFEKKVNLSLQEKGFESFLPLYKVIRQWSDRRKKVDQPLFSCYVFVRIPLSGRFHAVQTQGVVRIVSFNGSPAPIPDEEIAAVGKILKHADSIQTSHNFTKGQTVEIVHGPLKGIQGKLIELRGQKRLLVVIGQINQAISFEINESDVKPARVDLNKPN